MDDFWNSCFDPKMGLSPKDFEGTWCKACRNQECGRARGVGTKWLRRITTQVDRLFVNPKFADPEDPKYLDIRSVDFPSAVREAMRMEISSRKNDWTVPTEEEAIRLASEMVAAPPLTVEPPKAPLGDPSPVTPPPPNLEVLQKFDIRGTKGDDYEVTLVLVDGRQEWRCSCPAWAFGRARPCKHIEYAEGLSEEEPVEPEPPAGPQPTRFQSAPPKSQAAVPPKSPQRPFYPPLGNVPAPSGGVMVDGSSPPPRARAPATQEVDPWAPPPPKPTVIPVGGKVVLGGKK